MNSTDINQNENSYDYFFSSVDFNINLITKYSTFKYSTLNILKRFFSERKTYGSIFDIPFDILFPIHKQFDLTLRSFHDLRDHLIKSLIETEKKIIKIKNQKDLDFIYRLYLEKYRRTKFKIKYFNYIYDLESHIRYFLFKKMN